MQFLENFEEDTVDDVNFKDFYNIIRENLDSYEGDYDYFIDYGPDLFKLLTEILNIKTVNSEIKLKICAAIAYYVAPFDIIPETVYDPKGYIDDIYVCAYVLKEIRAELGIEFLDSIWEGEDDLNFAIDDAYEKSENVIKDQIENILAFIGLKNSL